MSSRRLWAAGTVLVLSTAFFLILPETISAFKEHYNHARLFSMNKNMTETTADPTPEMLLGLIAEAERCWRQSDCRKVLIRRLNQSQPEGGWKFKRCMLLGLGSFIEPDRRYRERRVRRSMQLAVFSDIAQTVHKYRDTTIELFVQEPCFTATDREVLERCGFQVLQRPEAENMIDQETFVMLPFTPIQLGIFGRERPADLMVALIYSHTLSLCDSTRHTKERAHVLGIGTNYERFPVCRGPSRFLPCIFSGKKHDHRLEDRVYVGSGLSGEIEWSKSRSSFLKWSLKIPIAS